MPEQNGNGADIFPSLEKRVERKEIYMSEEQRNINPLRLIIVLPHF